MYTNEKEILPAYVSKYNSNHKKQIIFLMITKKKKKRRMALHKKPSKPEGDFYCLNYLNSSGQKKSLCLRRKYVKISMWNCDAFRKKQYVKI